jgi:hypothetical protein
MASISALRARVESSLAGRIAAPFAYRDRRVADIVSSGIPEIDQLAGGLPRGGLTEICGPPCSGRTSLLLAALAARTAQGEACALVDGRDAFDPHAAKAAGVCLERLLWVRCRDIEQALRATDLLLRSGGFGLIAVDLADIEPRTVRGVALNTWFRFRRAVENTPSILLLVEQESNAKTCASLVLRLEGEVVRWAPECLPQGRRRTNHVSTDAAVEIPWTCLLDGFGVRVELVQTRVQPAREIAFAGAPPRRAIAGIFQTRTEWSVLTKTG